LTDEPSKGLINNSSMQKPFLSAHVQAFINAFRGIVTGIQRERSLRAHSLITLAVIAAGLWFHITSMEWTMAILAIGLIWATELINSAIEAFADFLHPEQHPEIGATKDMAAGGVLMASLAAAAIGLIIFLPYLCDCLA
jgi:diacylglycerol kinase